MKGHMISDETKIRINMLFMIIWYRYFYDTSFYHEWKNLILTLVILLFLALKESTSVICNNLAGKFSKSLLSNVKFFRLL